MAYRLFILVLCGGFSAIASLHPLHAGDLQSAPVFETAIQPLFAKRCGKCHGAKVRKAGLDLSTIHGVDQGGESGELLDPNLENSLLWALLESGEMPPEGETPLTKDELQLVRRWISTGARSSDANRQVEEAMGQHDVLPILLLRCTTCHGPRLQEGELDLRTRESILAGGKHGPAIELGLPDKSLMIQRIESQACPPQHLLLKFFVRRPPKTEVQLLRRWIAEGAPEGSEVPDVATTEPDPLVTEEDRQHWSFRPLQPWDAAFAPKSVDEVSHFVRRQLKQHGLEMAPRADRDVLIRRAFWDLVGMPPSVEQWRRWSQETADDWFAQMVDELLESPHYGERWGRYWLDLAGYADSEGGISADPLRPVAWKYRDYVIRAFNEDKPYDEFLVQQLAGDELVDFARADTINEEMVENLIATGFLRMGIDETGSRTMNFVPERLKVISDAIEIVSSGLMGLTMECARCHSHKYDPIPHRDYYRFKAVFQGALDEHDWSSFKTRKLKIATREHQQQVAKRNPPLMRQVKQLQSQQKKLESEIRLALLRHFYPEQSEGDRQATIAALRVADNNRTLPQKILVERLVKAELQPEPAQPEAARKLQRQLTQIKRQMDLLRRQMAPPLEIRALWDLGRPSPTYVLRRGEHDKPGQLVGPGVPSVLTDGKTPFVVEPPFANGTPTTGRRLAFARWLTQSDHPLTARVMVNRIWRHHFGAGLVRDLENFGRQGEPPTHPQLLDHLARKFVAGDWSVKAMHRIMMNSDVYQQSSKVSAATRRRDPQNRLLSRMPLRRMDAESLRDSLLMVAGRLDVDAGGPPDTVAVDRDGLVVANATASGNWRRSVYLQYRRTEIPTMMDTFDYPPMGPNCLTRTVSTVSPQALMLMNNFRVRELTNAFATRVAHAVEQRLEDSDAVVVAAYQLSLNRMPGKEERRLGRESLHQLTAAWQEAGVEHPANKALETYCHTLLNSAAFLFID